MTPHNEALKDDIAKIVLMPGDPKRVEEITKKFLKDAKLVNSIRGCLAYTGYYDNTKVTVMASGMGCASMGIYSYELFKFYDVDNIIRIGTAGSFTKELQLRDLLLVDSSYSSSNYAKTAFNLDNDTFISSTKLNQEISNVANNLDIKLSHGSVYCTDAFYEDNMDIDYLVKEKKCLSVEMETFALFSNAYKLGKNATALLTITDTFYSDEKLTPLERQNNFDNVVKLALETAKNINV